MKREFRIQNSEFRIRRKRLGTKVWTLSLWLVTCHLSLVTDAFGATHVTATYDLGANPRVMATVGGQPQYGLVFAQRNKAVTYQNVEYGPSVVKGYLNASGQLNDGAGNLWLDLIPNLGASPADSFYVVTFNIQGRVHAEIWVVPDVASVAAEACRQAQAPSSTAPALFYQFLQQSGESLPQRQKLNLIGSGVTCLDNAGQLRTDCTFTGGGGSAPIASASVSGTVKTDTTVADPVVYLQTSADTLLAGKASSVHTHSQNDVTNLTTDLAGKVPTSRNVGTSSPLAGGGALSADLALSCPTCEVTGNKNAASGYAGLTAATKLNAAQGQEVWALADLTDVASTTGTGTAAVLATNPTLADVTIDDVANFNETAGDATCAAGDTWIKFNSTAGKFRKCEDGLISDLDTGGGGASTGDAFVTIGHPADLTAERNLAGTSSEIIVTDGGANNDVTLSLDATVAQEDVANIFTEPQTINVGGVNTALSGKRDIDVGCFRQLLTIFQG